MKKENYYKFINPKILRLGILSALFLFLAIGGGYAAVLVKGKVTDSTGEPLIGVTVQMKGSTAVGTVTDLDGNYEITVPDQSVVLRFTYIGYVTKEESVGNRTTIHVQLLEDSKILNEVVVVGYDTQRKVNLTGAVASINVADQLEGRPITDVGRGLQGATAGLTVTTTSGQLGTTPEIRIRGAYGSLVNDAYGASRPLILVDGVEVSDLNMVNPDDIENISILKDAASSSIYGSRAAFGVLLITTKKGKQGDVFTANYSNNFAWTSPTVTPKLAKASENGRMVLESKFRQDGRTEYAINGLKYNAEIIERLEEWERNFGGMNLGQEMVLGRDFEIVDGNPQFYRSFNAADEFLQKGFIQQHNVSVSGASGKTSYYMGLGYMGDRGVLKVNPDQWNRYSVSFNTDTKVNKWLNLGSKLMFSRTDLYQPFEYNDNSINGWAFYYLYRWPANYPYGTYQGVPFRSSIADAMQANTNNDRKNHTRVTLNGTLTFTKDLWLDADYTFTMDNRLRQERGGEVVAWDYWTGGMKQIVTSPTAKNLYEQYNYSTDRHTANVILRYKKDIAKGHKLSAFAGCNLEYEYYNSMNGWKFDLLDFNKPSFNTAIGNERVIGSQSDWSGMGYFARANYSLKDRYLLELNGRYDGSTRFPLDQQWGFFPSGSVGWILSEESFMRATKSWLSFAKIRGSFGFIGNPNIGSNMFLPILAYNSNSYWLIDDKAPESTFGMPRALYKGFTWENIETRNGGLDLRFLNNKLGATFDLYRRINSGMVVTGDQVPATFGAAAPYMNLGEMTTNGWELSLDFHHSFSRDLKLRINANLSDAQIKITKHTYKSALLDGTNYEGKIMGEIWGFETDRYFTAADFAYDADGDRIYYRYVYDVDGNRVREYGKTGDYSKMAPGVAEQERYEGLAYGFSKYQPGDVKYKDLDGSGVIDRGAFRSDDYGDLKRIGNTTPRYEYSARIGVDYKDFDLDIFIQGVGSRQVWGTGQMIIPRWNFSELAIYAHQTDYWTEDNPNAFYPRLTENNQPSRTSEASGNFLAQSKYLLDMSYCRLKNVTLGYSIPKTLLSKAQLNKARVYVSFENLFELHNLGKIPVDPETDATTGDGGTAGFGRIYPYVRTISFGLQVSL